MPGKADKVVGAESDFEGRGNHTGPTEPHRTLSNYTKRGANSFSGDALVDKTLTSTRRFSARPAFSCSVPLPRIRPLRPAPRYAVPALHPAAPRK